MRKSVVSLLVALSPFAPRTSPILCFKPFRYKIPSVVVVFPASM